jgi:hypothetical protein
MKIIQTTYDGHRFRSRTEARWAVFFKAAGIPYEYEKEGVVLDGRPYLPDFWLPGFKMWLEVKGETPTQEERTLCQRLCEESGHSVLLAVGAPQAEKGHIEWFNPDPNAFGGGPGWLFADDRRNEGEFWLLSASGGCSIGPVNGPDHGKDPGVFTATARGYEAAIQARFEHGEKG